ncbi:MAG: dihydropteroate synthase [Pseudanabaenales cyanobacterium]|nr:dihydropteroate synthase [Pseudanabaenales cyanobacterium]
MTVKKPKSWVLRNQTLTWGSRTYLMGVLNVTPDSFSDGGQFNSLETAIAQARYLAKSGIDILDIGGQSTRPGAAQISLEEELARVIPVIKAIRSEPKAGLNLISISIDTTRAAVAQAAIEAGADLVNDISGGVFDPEMLATVAKLAAPIILMHMRGTPQTMQQLTDYEDLMGEISGFLAGQINRAMTAGVDPGLIAIDPGIGFAKTYEQNLAILHRLRELQKLGRPILVGPSRKSFIGWILDQPDPKQRVWGTAAACCGAIAGGADILRIHDGGEMRDVCRVADAIWRYQMGKEVGR